MSFSRSHLLVSCLAVIFSMFNVAAIAADETGARHATTPDYAGVMKAPGRSVASTERPLVVSLADPSGRTTEPPERSELLPKPPAWPGPPKFFTINQVLAKQRELGRSGPYRNQFAAIDPTTAIPGASPTTVAPARSNEPFGLFAFRAPQGRLWRKWRELETNLRVEAPLLARCRRDADRCTPASARFTAIIEQAAKRRGRARLELVNERVNADIRYTTDMTQWHEPDVWSVPLTTNNKGSFDTGLGDCEDYAIAKYVALRAAGTPAADLRLLLVRDNFVHMGHAVLAARQDGHWLILDNRWTRLIQDSNIKDFTVLFAIEDRGVEMYAAPYVMTQPAPHAILDSDLELPTLGTDSLSYWPTLSAETIGAGIGSLYAETIAPMDFRGDQAALY